MQRLQGRCGWETVTDWKSEVTGLNEKTFFEEKEIELNYQWDIGN